MEKENWPMEDATEWINYNTIRSLPYMGEDAPIIMNRLEDVDISIISGA